MSPRLPALFALSAFVFAAAPASAQKPTYTMTVTEHFNKKTGTSTYTQTLRNQRTGHVIWVRHFPGAGNITWSKDRRAVVFETGILDSDRPQHQFDIKLAAWQEGEKVQAFFTRPSIHADYVEDMFWSPDNRHLLFRVGGSGEADEDMGRLYCLNVRTQRALSVGLLVGQMQWVGSGRVKYWPIGFAHGSGNGFDGMRTYKSSKSRLWRLPKGF